jgi:translation elongation factor EF-Tu-like GTPase
MSEVIKITAKIKLFSGAGVRQTPFLNGYRPMFNFEGASTKISGKIELLNAASFGPGMSGIVTIVFLKGLIDGIYFRAGEKFTFDEE